jgi:hypothetical protein
VFFEKDDSQQYRIDGDETRERYDLGRISPRLVSKEETERANGIAKSEYGYAQGVFRPEIKGNPSDCLGSEQE